MLSTDWLTASLTTTWHAPTRKFTPRSPPIRAAPAALMGTLPTGARASRRGRSQRSRGSMLVRETRRDYHSTLAGFGMPAFGIHRRRLAPAGKRGTFHFSERRTPIVPSTTPGVLAQYP